MPERHIFELTVGSPALEVDVLGFRGREALSKPFRFDVRVRCDGTDATAIERAVIGQAARLVVRGGDRGDRRVAGIVTRVTSLGADRRGAAVYELRVVPKLWLLGRRRGYAIYQEKTVPAIAALVLGAAGVASSTQLFRAYVPRTYCAQYAETELAFLRRILAEEGIFFRFEHPESGSEVVVLGDDPHLYAAVAGGPMPFRPPIGLNAPGEHVLSLKARREVRSGRSHVREFDWTRPALHMHAEFDVHREGFDERTLEVYDHYDDFENADVTSDVAALHLEQLRQRERLAFGESHARSIAAGASFVIEGHPVPELDRAWAVIAAEHEGNRPEVDGGTGGDVAYRNRFTCVPADVPFRPRRPPRRTQQSIETATVVGPVGQEIHTDGSGRIKVQFHWDRVGKDDDKSSCWLRVAQAWAGAGFGAQFIPRVGMEVLVSFLTGDTDKPIVLGCVYNAEHPVPFALPANKTKSGLKTQSVQNPQGHNELSFEDKAGRERVHLHAERDLDVVVKNAHTASIGGSDTTQIGGNATRQVNESEFRIVGRTLVETVGEGSIRTVGGGEALTIIGGAERQVTGSQSTMVFEEARFEALGAVEARAGGDLQVAATGDLNANAGGLCELRALGLSINVVGGSTLTASTVGATASGALTIVSGERIQLLVGTSSIEIGADEIKIHASKITLTGTDELNLAGAAATAKLDGDIAIRGDTSTIFGSGSKIALDGDATLQGGSVKLGSGSGKSASTSSSSQSQNDTPPKIHFSTYVGIGRESSSQAALVVRNREGAEQQRTAASGAAETSNGYLVFELDPDAFADPIEVVLVDDDGVEHHLAGPVDAKRLRDAFVAGDAAAAHRLANRRAAAPPAGAPVRVDTGPPAAASPRGGAERQGDALSEYLEDWGEAAASGADAAGVGS